VDTKHKPADSGKVKRRRHSAAFKRELIARTLVPGASVARVALEHGINANLLFRWRRRQLPARGQASLQMLPVAIADLAAAQDARAPAPNRGSRSVGNGGAIEIELPTGRIRLKGAVDLPALRLALQMLSRSQ